MIKKCYVCEFIDEQSKIVGSGVVEVWIWSNAKTAFDKMTPSIPDELSPINFRRVK